LSDERSTPTADGVPSPYRSWLVAAVWVLLALLAVAGVKSYRDLAAARSYERELRARIAATGQRIEQLRKQIERIDNDPATLERLAREELGMVREGDVVVVLPPEDGEESDDPQLKQRP